MIICSRHPAGKKVLSAKTVVLHLQLNNHSFLNLEIQVLPATHIVFLDFTLFPENPEFNATYKLLNTKKHHLYSDKFTLSVVSLKYIDLASDEAAGCGINQLTDENARQKALLAENNIKY